MDDPDDVDRPDAPALSFRGRRLLRARVRARYAHVPRHWNQSLSGLIYVPAVAAQHIPKQARYNGPALLKELERLAALKVPWACAILGYQALLRRPDGTRQVERALDLCRAPAQSGDAYAQYVLAHALSLAGDAEAAVSHLLKSARQLFPPAVLDLTTALCAAKPTAGGKPAQRHRDLAFAASVGHAGALFRRLSFYRSGRAGLVYRLLGYLLMPLGALRLLIAALFTPFSADVFLFTGNLGCSALRFATPAPPASSPSRSATRA